MENQSPWLQKRFNHVKTIKPLAESVNDIDVFMKVETVLNFYKHSFW